MTDIYLSTVVDRNDCELDDVISHLFIFRIQIIQ